MSNAMKVLRMLADAEDTRLRVITGMKNWDWTPLVNILAVEPNQLITVTKQVFIDTAACLESLTTEVLPSADAKDVATGDKSPKALMALAHVKVLESGE